MNQEVTKKALETLPAAAAGRASWRRVAWEREVRMWAGFVLFAFLTMHLLNHALGIFGLATMEAVQVWRVWLWRTWPGTIALYGAAFLHVALADPSGLGEASAILERRLGHAVQRSTEGAELSVLGGTAREANEALAELIAGGIELSDFSMGQPSLDEVFFALTGQPASDEKEEAA